MKRMGWRDLYWLDIEALANAFKPANATLEFVKYYTSRSRDPRSQGVANRQQIYWRALKTLPKVQIIEGKILPRDSQCEADCKMGFVRLQEKETDVKLGIDVIHDCLTKKVQGIILITADTDQVPTLTMVRELKLSISVKLAFPPLDARRKASKELSDLAGKTFFIGESLLRSCQMPDPLMTPSGQLTRPDKWRRRR